MRWLVTFVFLSACSPNLLVRQGTAISCANDDGEECPPGYSCVLSIERCIARGGDQAPPRVIEDSISYSLTHLKRGAQTVLRFSVDEPLFVEPTVALASGVRFVLLSTDGLSFEYALTSDERIAEGSSAVTCSLVDTSGNTASDLGLGTLVFDYSAPQISRVTLAPALLSASKTLRVDLTVNEPLARDPAVALDDGQTFTMTAAPPVFSASYAVAPTDREGEHVVMIGVEDRAGNTSVTTESVRFDLTPPTLVDVVFLTSPATVGTVAGIVVTTSEPLVAPPDGALRSAGTISLLSQTTTSTVFSLTHTVEPSDADGSYSVELSPLEDLAGNQLILGSLGQVVIDTTPPAFTTAPTTGATTRFSAKSGHDQVTLTFALNEAVAVDVSLGNTPLTSCVPSLALHSFECSYTVAGTEPEGIVAFGVTASDAAGNRRFASTLIDLDFTPPSILPGTVVRTLTPPAASALATVDALSIGATAAISMLFSEPLASLTASTQSPAVLPMSSTGLATSWSVSLTLAAGTYTEQTPHSVRVIATDLLGNDATLDLGADAEFSIDVSAPPAPDTTSRDPEKIVYRRVPWGSDATLGLKRFTLSGITGAIEANTVVIAYEDASLTNEIGRSLPGATDGSFAEFALNAVDRAHVWVTQVDRAANASPGALVRHIEWTATMNGKVAGSSVPNPNTFLGAQRNISGLSPHAAQRVGELSGIGAVSGDRYVTDTGTEWNFVTNTQAVANARPPPQLLLPGAAWDDGSNRLVRFGGVRFVDSTCTSCSDASASCGAPCTLCGAVQIVDGQKACLMPRTQVAGISTLGPPTEYQWSLIPAGTAPSARFGMAMGYDSLRDQTILFGGRDPSLACTAGASEYCGDTWRLSGSVWTKLAPPGAQPSPRVGAHMVYDTAGSRFILFGGFDPTKACTLGLSVYCDDTWEWTGLAWSKIVTTGPSGRERSGLAYDVGLDRVILFGGRAAPGDCPGGLASDENAATLGWLCNDTWELKGSVWQPIVGSAPTPRFQVSLAYDLARGHTVMAGGTAQAPCDGGGWSRCAGLFALNGNDWLTLPVSDTSANGEPSPFEATTLVFERISSYLLLSGGRRVNFTGELWSLDGGGPARPRHIFSAELERAFDTGALELVKQVNFQPSFSPPPSGYLIDTGQPFGSRGGGESYGWDVDASSDARDRNDPDSLDERYDTFNHIAKPDGANATLWEIAIPNGSYLVHATCGDADFGGSCEICAEGSPVLKGAHAPGQWREDQAFIDVNDGRLSLASCTGVETKINYLEVRRLDLRRVSMTWRGGADSASYSPAAFVNLVGGGSQPAALATTFTGISGISGPAERIWNVELVSQTSGTLVNWCLHPQGVGGPVFCRSPSIGFAAGGAVNDSQSLLSSTIGNISALALSVNVSRAGAGTLQLRLVASAVGGANVSGGALMAFDRSAEDFVTLQTLAAPSATPGLSVWASSDAATIRPLVGRVPLSLSFALQPLSTSGWGSPAARVSTDYVETTVFYSLPP